MNPFRIATVVIFGALALIGVFIFATFSSRGGESVGQVEVWGTLDRQLIRNVLNEARSNVNTFNDVDYEEYPSEGFSDRLVEAIASGTGPDLVIVPAEIVLSERDKFLALSYRSVPRRDFQDTFVEAGEVMLYPEGVYGVPFQIDPFVTYWNRTIFSNKGIARVPKYWDEYSDLAPLVSSVNQNGTIITSAVALGEWSNVNHAKNIFLSLIYGLGNTVTSVNEKGEINALLSDPGTFNGIVPAQSALRFYTDFADPVKVMYSWNRSQQNSYDEFVAGRLATYFGVASEVFEIRSANPNLNFDVSNYPEIRNGVIATPSEMYVLAVPRGAQNTSGALQTALLFAGGVAQQSLLTQTGLPSVRRDLVTNNPENPYESLFRNAALNAFVFVDPDPKSTDAIFEAMVEAVSSGRFNVAEAVASAQQELQALVK